MNKRTQFAVKLSVRDATALALMLRLHMARCEESASQCWHYDASERSRIASRSWARAGRKARSMATQLESLALDAYHGQLPRNVPRIA